MTRYLLCFCLLLGISRSYAGKYFEHKKIGDLSFKLFIEQNHLDTFFRDTLHFGQYGIDFEIPFKTNHEVITYYQGMFALSDGVNKYSYGDISALAGDHSIDPLQIFQGLYQADYYSNVTPSVEFGDMVLEINNARCRQNSAIEHGYNEDSKYSFLGYIWLANEDRSHFQRPPQSFEEMLRSIDKTLVDLLDSAGRHPYKDCSHNMQLIELRKAIDKRFLKLSNTAKYAIMHFTALHYMTKAATADVNRTPVTFIKNFQFALIFNAYADHFLQDAFASGHIPVKRSPWKGLHNKGLHDYYCRNGLDVGNEKGEQWHTYGDGFYERETFRHAIEADCESLNDLWTCFSNAKKEYIAARLSTTPESLFSKIKNDSIKANEVPAFLHHNFMAFRLIPQPLDETEYKENIKLKGYSKSGFFYEAGATGYFSDKMQNIGWHAGIGVGTDITDYSNDGGNNIRKCGEHKEMVYWRGFGLNFSDCNLDNVRFHTLTGNIQFTYLDRLAGELNLGGLFARNVSYLLFRAAMGYEFKKMNFPIAPSLKVFYETSQWRQNNTGVMLSFKWY